MTEIKWTPEQEEIISKMLEESEMIGWVQGYDDAIKGTIEELKNKLFRKKNGSEI